MVSAGLATKQTTKAEITNQIIHDLIINLIRSDPWYLQDCSCTYTPD